MADGIRLNDSGFVKIECTTALQMIGELSHGNSLWHQDNTGWHLNWLFRGQANAEWSLLPAIWRDTYEISQLLSQIEDNEQDRVQAEEAIRDSERYGDRADDDNFQLETKCENLYRLFKRTNLELTLIQRFIEQADLRGFSIPDRARTLTFIQKWQAQDAWERMDLLVPRSPQSSEHSFDWHMRQLIKDNSVFSIAQHYGIPTRLLDWTQTPMAAAYFAAENAFIRIRNGEVINQIAVFAVRETILEKRGVKIFSFPRSDNPFLMAQEGRLSVHGNSYFHDGEYYSLDHLFANLSDEANESRPYMFTLSTNEVPELLRRLGLNGYTRDRLMPTLGNVAEYTKLRYQLEAELARKSKSL